jgi:hypothetical protein
MNHRTVWLVVHPGGKVEFLHEGDEPELNVLQRAVGGYIENIPDYYLWDGPALKHYAQLPINEPNPHTNEDFIDGGISRIICNEESKLELYGLIQNDDWEEKRSQYLRDNMNPLSYILQPHDFLLGRVVVQMVVKRDD